MKKINFTEIDFSSLNTLAIVASNDQISRDLAGEAVILNLKSGVYCGLNEVGARIWQLIQKPASIESIHKTLTSEYNVKSNRCMREILELLQKMSDYGLIEVIRETNN